MLLLTLEPINLCQLSWIWTYIDPRWSKRFVRYRWYNWHNVNLWRSL